MYCLASCLHCSKSAPKLMWVSVLEINCSNLLHLTMTASLSENFLQIFSTDKVFSLDDLNDNFLELSEVIV